MTLFSPEPKAFYKSHGFGPANTECSFEVWNLLSLSSRCLWGYENRLGADRLAGSFDKTLLQAAELTVNQALGSERVTYYMQQKSPWFFYKALKANSHSHLYLDQWHKQGLKGLVEARCYSWSPRKLTAYEEEFISMHSKSYRK